MLWENAYWWINSYLFVQSFSDLNDHCSPRCDYSTIVTRILAVVWCLLSSIRRKCSATRTRVLTLAKIVSEHAVYGIQ